MSDTDDIQVLEPTEISSQAETLVTITGLVQNYISSIDRLKKEITENQQMLQDSFLNDVTYKEKDDKAKEAIKARNAFKQQILKQPTLMALAEKIKDLRSSMKDSKQQLSDYLQEYQKLTGANEIEDAQGNLNEIRYTARLVKPSRKQ